VQQAASQLVFRLFIRLDVPQASAMPPCFPTSASDTCPSDERRRGRRFKWQTAWGGYPFEVAALEPSSTKRRSKKRGRQGLITPPGFSFAIVRNPFERLASAYETHIRKVPHANGGLDKQGAVWRSWIRQFHRMGENEPVSFSDFVRWAVMQSPEQMGPAWRPFSESCRFDRVQYSFIARLERIDDDFKTILRSIGLAAGGTATYRDGAVARVLEGLLSKTRPAMPLSAPGRLLQTMHWYLSDDTHDLVGLVSRRYRADIERFGYSFPANSTVTPFYRRTQKVGGDAG